MTSPPRPAPDRVVSSSPPLIVAGAHKRYGTTPALAGADFEVRPSELVGLLGPNGAGKTTLIKAIAGRLALDQGSVQLFGRTVRRVDPRPELGVVPQELAIYPLMTARENLEAFGRLYGVHGTALRERVEWALAWSDLADRTREPVKRFSGGMKRRLNIACSLLHQPSLVLLDEPTVGVDPQSRERIYDMLASLQRDHVAIVLTTHQLEEAERRCDRVVIIDRGHTVAAGTLPELVQRALGATRSLRVTLRSPLPDTAMLPDGATADASRRVVSAPLRAVGPDVAAVVAALTRAGADLDDLDITGASLQDVFIALTGRDLRE